MSTDHRADFTGSPETAAALDAADPLAAVRHEFHIPPGADGSPQTYLVGNSLGAVPTKTASYVQACLLYTSPSPRDATLSRMPSSA